jgi:hypothetical protein
MVSSGLLRRVRTDVLEERVASNTKVKRISELGTLQVTSKLILFWN